MKKYLLLLLVISLIGSSCTVSKRMAYLEIPDETTRDTTVQSLDYYEDKYGDYDGVYLLWEIIAEHSGQKAGVGDFNQDWSFHTMWQKKYLILNPDSKDLTKLEIPLKPEKIYIRLTYPDGTIKLYGLDDMTKEKRSSGGTSYKFVFPNIVKGTLVEYGADLSYWPAYALEDDVYLQFKIPCEKLRYSFAYPDWWTLKVKEIAPGVYPEYKTSTDEKHHKSYITYKADNIPAYEEEPFAPFAKELMPYLKFRVTNLTMTEGTYTELENWDEMSEELYKNYRDNSKYDKILDARAKELTENCVSDIEKMDTIISYIQNNIKPADDWKSRNYKNVLADQKGNSLEIAGLTCNLLERAGLNAILVLVHSADDGYFDRTFVSFDEVNIPAVCTKINGRLVVSLPYVESFPPGFVPPFLLGQTAVAITQNSGFVFLTIPEGDISDKTYTENYEIEINDNGIINVSEEIILDGAASVMTRNLIEMMNDDDRQELFESMIKKAAVDSELKSHEIVNLDLSLEKLIFKLNYTINNMVSIMPTEVVFRTGGLLSPITSVDYKELNVEERKSPIKIYFDEHHYKNIRIKFPESWSVQTEFGDIEYDNQFGFLQGSYKIEGNELAISQLTALKKSSDTKEKIKDLDELIGKSSELTISNIIFSKGQ